MPPLNNSHPIESTESHTLGALARQQTSMAFSYRSGINGVAMGLGEAVVIALSLFIGGYIRFMWKGDPMIASWMIYLIAAWILGSIAMKLLPGWGLDPWRNFGAPRYYWLGYLPPPPPCCSGEKPRTRPVDLP